MTMQEFEKWKKRAEAGDPEAQYETGFCYLGVDAPEGLEKNVPLGLEWLKKSAAQNYLDAVLSLQSIFDHDDGNIPSLSDYIFYVKQGASLGDPKSVDRYYILFETEVRLAVENPKRIFQTNPFDAVEYIRNAADAGYNRAAMHFCGLVHPFFGYLNFHHDPDCLALFDRLIDDWPIYRAKALNSKELEEHQIEYLKKGIVLEEFPARVLLEYWNEEEEEHYELLTSIFRKLFPYSANAKLLYYYALFYNTVTDQTKASTLKAAEIYSDCYHSTLSILDDDSADSQSVRSLSYALLEVMCRNGIGTEKDLNQAHAFCAKAAELGLESAAERLKHYKKKFLGGYTYIE